ncbi:MAG: flagellar motor switch phosphatase FliY [Eubacterium sp.]|nr:flagellar motor switch phosphatase FliY [Eubacterium sp.]
MDGMLSQEEINALLGSMEAGEDNQAGSDEIDTTPEVLTPEEADALGEVANISMGTAATTLSILVNNRVDITTPSVTYTTLDDLEHEQEEPCVFIYISYRAGLEGKNILVLNEKDVKIITDLMMGGDGSNTDGELGDLHLSAICEAMNQMMGSAATSMSSMLNKKVDISPPTATKVDFDQDMSEDIQEMRGKTFAKVSFHMEIGDLVDSQIMQLYPLEFARHIYEQFMGVTGVSAEKAPAPEPAPAASAEPVATATPTPAPAPATAPYEAPAASDLMAGMQPGVGAYGTAMPAQPDVNIQPAQFQNLSPAASLGGVAPENIDLIMDVPLEVTVELGRTSKSIKDILDFSPGTIIELDKLAGEPVDVLVNGKFVAKGEVVVIEESFGIRVTEIIKEQH